MKSISIWKTILAYGALMLGGIMFLIMTFLFLFADNYPQLFGGEPTRLTSLTSLWLKSWDKYVPFCMIFGATVGCIVLLINKITDKRKVSS